MNGARARNQRDGIRSWFGRAIGVLLVGLLVLGALAGCGGDENDEADGPLTKAEKRYIENMETHVENIERADAKITAGTLTAKQEFPQGGLPTDILDATMKYLETRRKQIDFWKDVDCPSERMGKLCGLWNDTLGAQIEWDDSLIAFINKPYTAANFKDVVAAGKKQGKLWSDCEDEIKQLEREASAK